MTNATNSLQVKLRLLSKAHHTKSGSRRKRSRAAGGLGSGHAHAAKKQPSETTTRDVEEYERAQETLDKELHIIENALEQVYKDQVQTVWGLYTHGLSHVLTIKDLSDAPDAILVKP